MGCTYIFLEPCLFENVFVPTLSLFDCFFLQGFKILLKCFVAFRVALENSSAIWFLIFSISLCFFLGSAAGGVSSTPCYSPHTLRKGCSLCPQLKHGVKTLRDMLWFESILITCTEHSVWPFHVKIRVLQFSEIFFKYFIGDFSPLIFPPAFFLKNFCYSDLGPPRLLHNYFSLLYIIFVFGITL